MIALEKANYIGRVECLKQEGGLIASITSYPDTTVAENLHYHETLHFSFILRGGNLEKRKHEDVERLPGTITSYNAGEPYQGTRIITGSRHVNIELTEDFMCLHSIRTGGQISERLKRPDARFLMMRTARELLWNDSDSLPGIQSSILALLLTPKQNNVHGPRPAWAFRVQELLHDQWNEPLSLQELSIVAGLHPCNLSSWFSTYFGCTISQYRRRLRIEKAVTMMATRSYTLTQISYQCGFADQSHFTRVFKEFTGWAPKPYEKLNRP